jgi:hypothetical protein
LDVVDRVGVAQSQPSPNLASLAIKYALSAAGRIPDP